jgi:hypothetical protein
MLIISAYFPLGDRRDRTPVGTRLGLMRAQPKVQHIFGLEEAGNGSIGNSTVNYFDSTLIAGFDGEF